MTLWHEDVTAWGIYENDELVGRFYMDLFPRAGKYSHTAFFSFGERGVDDLPLTLAILKSRRTAR